MELGNKAIIKSIEKGAMVINAFTKKESELTLNDISKKIGFNKTTLLRICNSLVRIGYLEKIESGSVPFYRLGVEFLRIGNIVNNSIDTNIRAKPYLREVVEKTGDNAYLIMERNKKAYCVDRVEGTHFIRTTALEIGAALKWNAGAGSVLLLSYFDKVKQEEIIKELNLKNSREFWNRLQEVNRSQVCISKNEVYPETAAVGVPIFNYEGEVIAALSTGGVLNRFSEERLPKIINEMSSIGSRLSQELGYKGEVNNL